MIEKDLTGEVWDRTCNALAHGDFSALDEMLSHEGISIIDLLDSNETTHAQLAEALTWASFTGHEDVVSTLLDRGVDPAAGTATGLSALHWAANRGNLDIVKLLIERGAPLEQKNMYDGTVLGCTLYSAINEPRDSHAAIAEAVIAAGARLDQEWLDWWDAQNVPSAETKTSIAESLRRRLDKVA